MTGDLFIYRGTTKPSNPIVDSEWLDVYTEWGVSFEDGALDSLMTFRPNKEPIVNKNVTANGASYVTGAGLMDERTINIPFHIVAFDKADFLLKRDGFYRAIQSGLLYLRVQNPVDCIYQLYYISCNQYTQYLDGLGKFVLTMYETNRYSDDSGSKPIEPMPEHEDMVAYLSELLDRYGMIATEEEVRDIVRNYNNE